MEIKMGILFLFLLFCSLWDLKSRSIPLWFCYVGIALMLVSRLFLRELEVMEILGGLLIGILLLGISRLTRGQIGSGDGIIFIVTGIGLGIWDNFVLLTGSLFLVFIFSLIFIFMKKINLKGRLPFVPFIFAAYTLELLIKLT